MRRTLITITAALEEAARDLAGSYDPTRLYDLRVCIRRMRSLLKGRPGRRAQRFRRIWGGFAAQTNPARDWDVFLLAAADLLTPTELREFERLNRKAVRHARQDAVRLVRSAHWRRVLLEWKEYLERAGNTRNVVGSPESDLCIAHDRASMARTVALAEETDRAWHKLRIAIKELRYRTEAASSSKVDGEQRAKTLEVCKALQSALGHWHDTVVQLELIDTLPHAPVLETLRAALTELQDSRLAEVRALCAADAASMFTG